MPFPALPSRMKTWAARASALTDRCAVGARTFRRGIWLVLLAVSLPAAAQSPVCEQIRAELGQMANAGSGVTRDSTRLRTELSRVRLAMQQNECNKQGFLFFGAPPPVCSPLRAQAAQYEAQIRQIEGGAGNPRRAQLIAALDRYGCIGGQPAPQRGVIYATPGSPSLMDQLFGPNSENNTRPYDPEGEPRERLGGRMAICVRTCDGFYFPVNFEGIGARDEYAQVCQSLCPAAETQVFFMPLGADVERAATRDGTPYMSLPMAKKYQTSRDPACFCKPTGQTWASAMKGVEDLVETRKGDIVVTPEQALAMSRAKGPAALVDAKGKKLPQPAKPPQAEPEAPASLPESALPTGGTASSGIGPRIAPGQPAHPQTGVTQQTIGADGNKRTVRNVAPGLIGREPRVDLRGEVRP